MYIQITDHCNMACAHCCYSCGPRKKNFITTKMFEAALEFDNGYLAIGGGEPTLHPQFWEFVGIGLAVCDGVWLATNGSQTKITLRLANMARRGVLGCALSQDFYHSQIDQKVIDAFKGAENYGYRRADNDLREIRDVSYNVVRQGRAIRTQVWQEEGCGCEGLMVDPLGNIWSCGCKKLLLGHVLTGWNEVGERRRTAYRHERWNDIEIDGCYFKGKYQRAERLAFARWLKEAQ